jgi:hypothetical protein
MKLMTTSGLAFRSLSRMGEGGGEGDSTTLRPSPLSTVVTRQTEAASGCSYFIPLTLSLSHPGEGTRTREL